MTGVQRSTLAAKWLERQLRVGSQGENWDGKTVKMRFPDVLMGFDEILLCEDA